MVSDKNKIAISMVSSGMAEAITCPLDTIKVNMQAASNNGIRDPLRYSIARIYGVSGIQGFYRSVGPSVTRQMLSGGVRLGLYETTNSTSIGKQMKSIPFVGSIAQGAFCGVIACTLSMPMDLIKTRVQAVQGTSKATTSMGMIKNVLGESGLVGFYSGYLQSLQRSVMISAIQIPTYFYIQKELEQYQDLLNLNVRSSLSVLGCTLVTTTCVYPIDLAKTKIQHEGLTRTSTVKMINRVARETGVSGLYRGASVSFVRALPQFWLTSLFYENLKNYMRI
mgnify:CR=1 FL=1|tara:strand:- start:9144 stop:9983 length:840 start_codon:yes stop_codon:yes gene_type:complete